jgi:hypothetical protein
MIDHFSDAEKLATQLKQCGSYRDVRVLDDGSIAGIRDLIYTRAIFLSCTDWGYGSRFCFEDRQLADQRFAELKSEDDVPLGYTARRNG